MPSILPYAATALIAVLAVLVGSSLTVPEAPASASLTVLSGESIELAFTSPVSDGGSAISAYTVEWDTDNGTPEEQVITASTYVGPNEVQTITTSAPDVDEVQSFETRTTAYREIQTITVSPPVGSNTMNSGWSFALSLDTTSDLQYSGAISATAAATGSANPRVDVDTIIGLMLNVDSTPTVTRTSNGDGGYTWSVTFPESMGNVPEMTAYTSDVPISFNTEQEGNVIGGTFRLEFDGETTGDLAHDASELDVQLELESLSTIGTVSVSRGKSVTYEHQGGYIWSVTFTSDFNAGNINELTALNAGLSTTNTIQNGGGATVGVNTDTEGNEISGTFDLSYTDLLGNTATISGIPFGATPAEFTDKLLQSSSTIFPAGSVHVDRSAADFELGYTWTVSFLEDYPQTHKGNLNEFVPVEFGGSIWRCCHCHHS
jgi:hypothetical protein